MWVNVYPGACVQGTKECYQHPEMPFPADVPEHPTADDIVAYAERFVETFGLGGHPCLLSMLSHAHRRQRLR